MRCYSLSVQIRQYPLFYPLVKFLKIFPLRFSMSEMMLHCCYVREHVGQGPWYGTSSCMPSEPSILLHIDLPDCRQFCSVKKHEYHFKEESWSLLVIFDKKGAFQVMSYE